MLLICDFGHADDWPQILGPNRDGVAANEKITSSFPKAGPKIVWSSKTGSGFAGPAIVSDSVYLFHRIDDDDVLEVRDAATGKEKWTAKMPTAFSASYTSDNGPRCVPLIAGERVYLFGAAGGLYCFDTKKHEKIWERQTHREFKAQAGFFGAGSTPLLEGGRLIVNVGSRNGAGVVAFDAKTGKTLWESTDNQASYSSPIAVTINGTRHILVVTRYNTVSLDPENGNVRFSFPFGKRGPTVNGSNPVVMGDKLFMTASYGIGASFRTIKNNDAPEIWKADGIASQYSTFVPLNGRLFGIDGRQDSGAGSSRLVCFDPNSQKIMWEKTGFDYGSVLLADNKLIIVTNTGELLLVEATADAYRELAKAKVLQATSSGYRLPALSNGRLLIRDDSELKCLYIGQ